MKLPPSALLIKLFSDLPQASRRSSSGGKVLLGSLVALSVFITISHFPGMELPSMNLAVAAPTPATSNLPLFGNPTSEDFMSYAVSIMPTVPGANLNTSNVAGSTNCDLLVPVTYIDAGCMNSLPLLFPFNEPQHTNIAEPTNQTFYNDYNNSSALDLSIGVASDNITAGDTQTVTVSVSDQNSTQPIPGALVLTNVTDSFNSLLHQYSGTADEVGQVSFPFVIPADAASDIYTVSVLASADGYENTSASTTFDVIGSGDFFDNSTFDNSFDSSSSSDGSSDNCCDSSSDDFNSPTVKSVSPGHNEDNVPLDTKIKVTFDEKMDQNTLDDGSLFLENVDGFGNVPNFNADPSSKSVTYTLDEPLEPGTTYRAQIEFSVEDDNGNSIDCIDSNDVDSNCQWEFTTTGTSGSAITLNPTSGPGGTQVTITGTGFVPDSSVIITFDVNTVLTTVTSNNDGGFSTTITVPPLSSTGTHSIAANLASKIFTVTSSTSPLTVTIINPSSGSTDVPVTSSIKATFNKPVEPTTVSTSTFTLKNSTGASVNGVVSLSENGLVATFDPIDKLSSSETYTATLTTGVKDLAGNALTPAKAWSFTTAPLDTSPPTIVSTNPQCCDGPADVPVGDPVSARFSEPMDESTITTSTVTLESTNPPTIVTGTVSLSSDLKTATFVPSANLSPSTEYLATITTGAKDLAGNPMESPFSWSFTTSSQSSLSAAKVKDNSIAVGPLNTTVTKQNDSQSNSSTLVSTKISNKLNTTTSTSSKAESHTTLVNRPNASTSSIETKRHDSNTKNFDSGSSVGTLDNIPGNEMTHTMRTIPSENDSNANTKIKTNDNPKKTTQEQITHNSVTKEVVDKTNTKVTRSDSDNQPEKQSRSSDSIKKDRALFFKYLNSNKDNVKEEQKIEVNNRPLAVDDDATTESNIPVKINILGNDKDPDGDKLSVMGVSRPVRGTIESDNDGTITYSPLKSWSGTERFGYTISDGRGGVATGTVTVIVQNQPPEAEDQDVSVNANSPIKIKLEAKDPDDDKLKFVLVTKPSHGRIAQFSSSTGTLGYVPDENYDGKDDFTFKVHDGTVFSKDAKVSIKIEKNEKLSNDPVQGSDQQQKKEPSRQSPTNEKKSSDDKSNNNDTPPSDSSQQPSTSSQDTEQPIKDQKEEQQQSIEPDKSTSDGNTVPRGDSQPNS